MYARIALALMLSCTLVALAVGTVEPLRWRLDEPARYSLSSHRNGPWFPDPGQSTYTLSLAHVWDKTFSPRLHYDFPTAGHDAVIVSTPGMRISEEYEWGAWPVYGDGSGHELYIQVSDAGGESHYLPVEENGLVTWRGWKTVWLDLRQRPLSGWGGNNAQVLEPPVTVRGIVMCDEPETFQGQGDLWFGDVTFMTSDMRADAERAAAEERPPTLQLDTVGNFKIGCPDLGPLPGGEADWAILREKGATITEFLTTDGAKPKEPMRAWLGTSSGRLVIGCLCETADVPKVQAKHQQRDAPVYEDECVELFIEPTQGAGKYYHISVNSEGVIADEICGAEGRDVSWTCDVRALPGKEERAWSLLLSLPLEAVGISDSPGDTVGFNLCRENHLVAENLCWRPTGPSFHNPARFGELIIGAGKVFPTAIILQGPWLGSNPVTVTLRNAGGPVSVSVSATVADEAGSRECSVGEAALPETGEATLNGAVDLTAEGNNALRLTVRSQAGNVLYRSQAYQIAIPKIGERLEAVAASLNATEARLDALQLPEAAARPLKERLAELRGFAAELEVRRRSDDMRRPAAPERLLRDMERVIADPAQRVALAVQAYAQRSGRGETVAPIEYVLGVADSMTKVFRDEPYAGPVAESLHIEAAKNEIEGVQLLVIPTAGKEIRFATLEISDLRGPGEAVIPADRIEWDVVGYVALEKPRKTGEPYELDRYWPDPLLRQRYFHVKPNEVQPVWIKVRVPADVPAGEYQGMVAVRPVAQHETRLPLRVTVWDFAIPKEQHLETSFPLRPSNLQTFYKLPRLPIELFERWMDFCLENRIAVNLVDWGDYARDFERLVGRQLEAGGSAFCIDYAWFSRGDAEQRKAHNAKVVERIRPLYETAKRHGWLNRAYVYLHDEVGQEDYALARELYSALKEAFPDLRLMQTFYRDDPITGLGDLIDIWAPNTGRYRREEFHARQAQGDEVWWYVCCGPGKPFANLMINWPGIAPRILLWQNWKLGVTGHLYWGLDWWSENLKTEPRWPDSPWDPASWRNEAGIAHHGDGYLLYPGPDLLPLSSVRFENLRDGIEDYEYFWLLRDNYQKLKASGRGSPELLEAAQQALAIDDALCQDLTHWTEAPAPLRAARAQVARLIVETGRALH